MKKVSSILKKIVENKKKEVFDKKNKISLFTIKDKLVKSNRDFLSVIKGDDINLIAEIKKASPTMKIDRSINIVELANFYEESNVSAISVLCDKKYFNGSLEDLDKVRKNTANVPLLCKDFIVDEYQIYEARYYGADAILLIVNILKEEELRRFLNIAHTLNMNVIFEINSKEELNFIRKIKFKIIMINNRDLNTFEIDLNTTNSLVNFIPEDKVIISASGINSFLDVQKLSKRVSAILVETSIMKSDNPKEKIKELLCKK